MEALLRGQKPTEVIPFDLEAGVLYYPIRHHSPVCAWHLERVLERYRPDCILVEGPENAGDLLPLLADPETQAPVALYYACRDGSLEEPVTYRCYYPFLDTSPELAAVRYGVREGIETAFMDLSYGAMVLATREARGLRTLEERQSYANDRYLSENRFQQRLCEKSGVRSFEEFWEKYFEAEGFGLTTERFVALMNRYCLLCREHTPARELEEDGCLAREAHMAARIAEAKQRHRRVLVVAGGFHLYGLLHPAQADPGNVLPRHMTQSVYPMRYDLPSADALSGYASGIRGPGFYDALWQRLHGDRPEMAWEESVLDFLVKTGRDIRRSGENLSASEERSAYEMALGLAVLRDKRHPGLYELEDGVLSAFVKGEASLSGVEPLRLLRRRTTGSKVGILAQGAATPPIHRDFEEQCRRLRLSLTENQESVLSIFTEKKHREVSRFFHQTVFLDCGFANRRRGPDLLSGRDRNLIRETWEYRWSPRVDSALIEHALSGATVREACAARLRKRMSEAQRSSEGADLLTAAMLMGIGDHSDFLQEKMTVLLLTDGDFSSLAEACRGLYTLLQWQSRYGGTIFRASLLGRAFDRVLLLLPSLHSVDDRAVGGVQESCRLLYELTLRPEFGERREKFFSALELLISNQSINPALHGTALGILYGLEPEYRESIDTVTRGYLRGTPGMQRKAAAYLQGLFYAARDLLLTDGEFLGHIDALLSELEEEVFLEALPQLRLAFSYFLPRETDRIAREVAAMHQTESKMIQTPGIDPAFYARNERIDAWAAARLKEGKP